MCPPACFWYMPALNAYSTSTENDFVRYCLWYCYSYFGIVLLGVVNCKSLPHTKEVMFSSMLVHLLVSRITAVAGKTKAGTAHSDCGWTCGCALQVKLWDPLRTRAIPEHFWGDDSQRGAISSVRTFTFTEKLLDWSSRSSVEGGTLPVEET